MNVGHVANIRSAESFDQRMSVCVVRPRGHESILFVHAANPIFTDHNSYIFYQTGCPYGDKSDWCQTNIASQRDKQTCYWGHNSDLCCESCAKYENIAHIGKGFLCVCVSFLNSSYSFTRQSYFYDPDKGSFWKHRGKRKTKCWYSAFFPFSHYIFYPFHIKFQFLI